ncbi:MAG: hypothetical protein U9Q74_15675, partial [Gemmatimonadota bacterium]|nr:hypothetical protein [Gemmatimonadota bacterium]
PGLMKAELRADDDLRADNVAFAQAAPAGGRVLVVGPENLFLEQVLAIQPGIELFRVDTLSEAQAAEAWEAYDAIVFDRGSVPAPPVRGAALLIDAGGWPALATRGEAVEEPRISFWEAEHPVLRHVNLRAIGIAEGHALAPGPDATAIARADDAPMVVALQRGELRAVALGWNLLDSDLPLRVGFPVLLRNILGWLGEVRGEEVARVMRPGTTVRFAAPPEVRSADLVTPDGRRRSVEAMGGELTVAGSESVGVYRLVAGERRWRWAADLRDPAESDLTPRTELTVGGKVMAAGRREVRTQRHLWPWLVALALVALAVEWHFYHRRY